MNGTLRSLIRSFRCLLLATVSFGLSISEVASQVPRTDKTAVASPVESGIIVVEFEIKEEKKQRDDLTKKVEQLPPAQRTQASDELKWASQQMEFAAKELVRARAEKNEAKENQGSEGEGEQSAISLGNFDYLAS